MGTVIFVSEKEFESYCKTHWVVCARKTTDGYRCVVKE